MKLRTYLAYAAAHEPALALPARLLVAELAQQQAQDVKADRAAAAALLADLGSHMQQGAQEAGAEDLFQQAARVA